MPAPTSTPWPIEPHTRAKHAILERYSKAWFAVLGQSRFSELVYIDGFAGPGRYSQGEDGSPIIALRAALAYRGLKLPPMTFLFVESKKERADMLRGILSEMRFPSNFSVTVAGDEAPTSGFETVVTSFIDERTRDGRSLPQYLLSSTHLDGGFRLTLCVAFCHSQDVRCL